MDSFQEQYDYKTDRLYVRKIKCPYCGARINKLQMTCEQCGISKEQIAHASNKKAKEMIREGERGKIVMIKSRPEDVSFSKMVSWLVLGLFGAHCFYVGRTTRGFIMLGLIAVCIIFIFILPVGHWDATMPDVNGNPIGGIVGMHPWRQTLSQQGWPFPTDFLGLAAFAMWSVDTFAVVFGWFKYPVRLGEKKYSNADLTKQTAAEPA